MEAQVSGVRLAEQERQRIEQLVKMGYYVNLADFLRDAVRSKLQEFEFRFVRNVGLAKAKKEVFQFIRENPNVYADDIAARLGLDIETVLKAIEGLAKESKVEYG